jgi:hypothetical protein
MPAKITSHTEQAIAGGWTWAVTCAGDPRIALRLTGHATYKATAEKERSYAHAAAERMIAEAGYSA